MLLWTAILLAQAEADSGGGENLTAATLAAIVTAALTGGAALMGAWTAWRKRQDEARRMENEEDSITITQAQGANLVLDATVKALNTQLDREAARADRERDRADRLERRVRTLNGQLEAEKARADTAERALDVARRELTNLRGGGA